MYISSKKHVDTCTCSSSLHLPQTEHCLAFSHHLVLCAHHNWVTKIYAIISVKCNICTHQIIDIIGRRCERTYVRARGMHRRILRTSQLLWHAKSSEALLIIQLFARTIIIDKLAHPKYRCHISLTRVASTVCLLYRPRWGLALSRNYRRLPAPAAAGARRSKKLI